MTKINHFEKFKASKNRKMEIIKNKIKNRNHFRLTKTKEGYKYKIPKRLKHTSKMLSMNFIRKICSKPMGIIDLLVKMKIYKHTLSLKLIFILIPFVILLLIDNVVMAIIIATIDIFCCAIMFSITATERQEALVNGKFDYGKYKQIKAKKETIAILLMFFVSSVLIILGHTTLNSLVQTMSGMVLE